MVKEIETQVLDINVDEIVRKLRRIGSLETPEALQKRWVFYIEPCTADSMGEWIRLRQVGDNKPTITYKCKSGKGRLDTDELEIEVDDFNKAAELLSKLPFKSKSYQENRRLKFIKDKIEFTLDTWPMIPTYLEIEASSDKELEQGLAMLGLFGQDVGHLGSMAIYKKYGIDSSRIPFLKF